jgi:uncharacterized protein
MTAALNEVLRTLRNHESELRHLGVSHAAVFGSVARGEATAGSDIDVLVDAIDVLRGVATAEFNRLQSAP